MRLDFDLKEIGLIALLAALFVVREFIPRLARRSIRRPSPRRGSGEERPEWTAAQKTALGLLGALFLVILFGLDSDRGWGSALGKLGILLLVIGIKGLIGLRAKSR